MATYNFNAASGNMNSSSKSLKRMEFEFNGGIFKFTLNPETYNQSEPGKLNITQTKAGAFLEAFGAGIVEISFSGTTGYKGTTTDKENGYKQFKKLRDMIRLVYSSVQDGKEITKFLNFYNFTDNEYYVTYPDKFELSKSKSQPFLYKYDIHLYCIRRIGESAVSSNTVSVVGNPIGVEKTYSTTLADSKSGTTTNK